MGPPQNPQILWGEDEQRNEMDARRRRAEWSGVCEDDGLLDDPHI